MPPQPCDRGLAGGMVDETFFVFGTTFLVMISKRHHVVACNSTIKMRRQSGCKSQDPYPANGHRYPTVKLSTC